MTIIVNPISIVLVNLFWLIFLIPGFALLKYYFKPKGFNTPLWLVFSFFLSASILLPVNIIGLFVLIKPIFYILYFLLFVFAGLYLFIKNGFFSEVLLKIKGFDKTKLFSFLPLILAAAIIFDFILSVTIKGFAHFGFDAWVHLAKANFTANNGFSIFDPYLLENGKDVIQSNYFSNISHLLLALPAKFFGISVIDVWAYSVSFFRILAFSIVYSFIFTLFRKKWISIFLLVVFYFQQAFSLGYMIPMYPIYLAFLFSLIAIMLLKFILSSEYFENSKRLYPLYILGIVAVSFLHPVQSNLLAIFISGLLIILLVFKEIRLPQFAKLWTPLLLGLPTSILTLQFSKFVPNAVLNINNDLYFLTNTIFALKYPGGGITIWLVMLAAGIYVVNIYIKNRIDKSIIFYGLMLNILILYTPLFMVLHKLMPTWAIVRYEYFNGLLVLMITYSVFAFMLEKYSSQVKDFSKYIGAGLVVLAIVMNTQTNFRTFYDLSAGNQGNYIRIRELQTFEKYIPPRSVILANQDISFSAPAIYNCYVAGLDDTRTTDSIETKEREIDLKNFLSGKTGAGKRETIINKYSVKTIILDKKESEMIHVEEVGFKKQAETEHYIVYVKNV